MSAFTTLTVSREAAVKKLAEFGIRPRYPLTYDLLGETLDMHLRHTLYNFSVVDRDGPDDEKLDGLDFRMAPVSQADSAREPVTAAYVISLFETFASGAAEDRPAVGAAVREAIATVREVLGDRLPPEEE